MRNILSLLLALAILLSTLLFGCFYMNISKGAKFETQKSEERSSAIE